MATQSQMTSLLCVCVFAGVLSPSMAQTDAIPVVGPEAESLDFALSTYNTYYNKRDNISKAWTLERISSEVKNERKLGDESIEPTEIWYRLFGVQVTDTKCPRTTENLALLDSNPNQCPPVPPDPASRPKGEPIWVQICQFTVKYLVRVPKDQRFDMIYQMCW